MISGKDDEVNNKGIDSRLNAMRADIGIVENITANKMEIIYISNLSTESFTLTQKALDSITGDQITAGNMVTIKHKGSNITNLMKVKSLTVVGKYENINTDAKTLNIDIKGKSMVLKYEDKVENELIKSKENQPLVLNVQKINNDLVVMGVRI